MGTNCNEDCRKPVYCTTCNRHKKPRGRDPGAAAANGLCDPDCEGYYSAPQAGHLWPGEDFDQSSAIPDGEPGPTGGEK